MINSKKILKKKLLQSYIFKSFGSFSVAQGINGLFAFVLMGIFTKYLPPSEYGKISLLWMTILIMYIITDFRINTAFSIRFYKETPSENTINIYSGLLFNTIIILIIYLLTLLFAEYIKNLLKISLTNIEITILFVLVLGMVYGNFFTNYMIVSKQPKLYLIIISVFNIILIVSAISLIKIFNNGYIAWFQSYCIAYSLISIIGLIYFFNKFKPTSLTVFSFKNMGNMLKIGIPLVPVALLLMLLTWADRYILNIYIGLTVVGIYSVGYKFCEIIDRFIFTPFGQAVTPIIFEKYSSDKEQYHKILSLIFKYYWVCGIFVFILYFAFLQDIFLFFIGKEYAEGYNIIAIVLLGILLWGGANLISATIILHEKTSKTFYFTFFTVLLNIILNFVLIPCLGLYGAAVATFISYILYFILILWYTQKLEYIKFDYKFVITSLIVSIIFLSSIISVSYLPIDMGYIRIIKIVLVIFSIIWFYNFLNIKRTILSKL